MSPRRLVPTDVTFTVEAPAGWVSANDRGGWRVHASKTKAWRSATRLIVHTLHRGTTPMPGPVEVTCVVHRTTNVRSDAPNVAPTLKACVDGAVDAGLLTDDNDSVIKRTVFERGPNRPRPALTLTFRALKEKS
jgi:hypothetical protein